jgi:N-hydroxyarylamine O-acetyltransferase
VTIDLERYFRRIGWTGSREPTREVLSALLVQHMHAVPFENLDVLLGRPPQLGLDVLEDKLVVRRRGGYCYEHSTLFAAVLRALGFEVNTHSARVVLFTGRNESPRTHMFLTTGDVMLDPGFGGMAPRVPVPLDGTDAAGYRLVRDGGDTVLECEGQRMWVSSLERDVPVDFEMANHFTATHPSSHFTRGLTLRAFTADGQVRIRNREVVFMRGADTQVRPIVDRAELRVLVAEHFGFDLPELETIQIPNWS